MSYIYAHKFKNDYTNGETIEILSDTKIMFNEIEEKALDAKTLKNIKKYGIIKIIIVDSQCCIAFAGNNIKLVNNLLDLYSKTEKNITKLIDLAYELHCENPINDIEFIICYNDANNIKHIVCIKERKKNLNENFCWIGSSSAFYVMQKERQGNTLPVNQLFSNAIESGVDVSVGGCVIKATYSNSFKEFIYNSYQYSVVSKPRTYNAGEKIIIMDTKENGGYTISVTGFKDEVHLMFEQIGKLIIYCKEKITCDTCNKIKKDYKYFLIPHEV